MATVVTSYAEARAKLASLCDHVSSTREMVIIKRRNAEDVALVSAEELEGIIEAAHLLRSPKNAARLIKALERAHTHTIAPLSIEALRKKVGLEKK
jgi:antitoxin YefM